MATLTINFVAPSPVPYGGFVVKYRAIGTSTYTTVSPNPVASPVVIPGVTAGTGYEGTISSNCGNGSQSASIGFVAYASNPLYTLYGSTAELACSAAPSLVYIGIASSDIATGVMVYTDQSLTTPLSGASFILNSGGNIYNISGGLVGSATGNTC